MLFPLAQLFPKPFFPVTEHAIKILSLSQFSWVYLHFSIFCFSVLCYVFSVLSSYLNSFTQMAYHSLFQFSFFILQGSELSPISFSIKPTVASPCYCYRLLDHKVVIKINPHLIKNTRNMLLRDLRF